VSGLENILLSGSLAAHYFYTKIRRALFLLFDNFPPPITRSLLYIEICRNMPTTPTPSLLNATATEFAPGHSAHPSPAPSERFSSPSTPLSAVNFQSQFQFPPQKYYSQQKQYGYQPFPLFNGYTQTYDFPATPPPYSAQPQGAVPWYPQQNGYVSYTVNSQEPFDDQFRELQGVRNGYVPSQQVRSNCTKYV
jgi:hypothetical protein